MRGRPGARLRPGPGRVVTGRALPIGAATPYAFPPQVIALAR
ncbi:hypothetical protein HMPREF0731_1499 [Pseudoroseomonas cervicalis ATCC 49957]|uniref:Uncharacterized protein n=1 Tax=Pseudoroseomonas cervicalis ATCC 49957 TaxID=525371 RepID=D5RK89_9PROT|nr:hypothetical protein HMPREF0731_1499 [Pseudoroseomonas cervicalis ATCC 49957]